MKTALVIEDNEDNMELITFILEQNGCQTIRACTGREGVELAISEQPNFLLLDIQLPDIPGTEVLALIRNHADCRTIPIIAVTSYAMSGDREKLLAAGCEGYIEKPIDPLRFMAQIEKVLGK